MPMVIKQTNRTILFEEINPEKLDLLTMIGDVKGIDSLSDDKIKEINQYLECRSFNVAALMSFKPNLRRASILSLMQTASRSDMY